jgi:stage III sporulation protein AF
MGVITFISSWLKDIVVLFILISIVELIMPKGNMKRYINLVIGLLIIYTIINPFAKLMKLDFNLDQEVFNYSKPNEVAINNNFHTQQDELVENLYKDKIIKEVIELVEINTDYKIIDISVGIINSKEKYGEIDHLNLLVDTKDNNDKKISIKKVVPVDVQMNSKIEDKVESGEFSELEDLISSKYSIEKEKITISKYEKENGDKNE